MGWNFEDNENPMMSVQGFCDRHWNTLREKIREVGLEPWVAENGREAHRRVTDQMQRGEVTVDNFEPLFQAHIAIIMNALDVVGDELAEVSGCPLCYLNKTHEEHCDGPPCEMDQVNGYDVWLDYAVNDQIELLEELKL